MSNANARPSEVSNVAICLPNAKIFSAPRGGKGRGRRERRKRGREGEKRRGKGKSLLKSSGGGETGDFLDVGLGLEQ